MNVTVKNLREFRFKIRCGCGLEDGVTVKGFDPKMPARWAMECYACGNTLACQYSQLTGAVMLSVEGGEPVEVARAPRTWR